jgi:hypothetical protein
VARSQAKPRRSRHCKANVKLLRLPTFLGRFRAHSRTVSARQTGPPILPSRVPPLSPTKGLDEREDDLQQIGHAEQHATTHGGTSTLFAVLAPGQPS